MLDEVIGECGFVGRECAIEDGDRMAALAYVSGEIEESEREIWTRRGMLGGALAEKERVPQGDAGHTGEPSATLTF